MRNVRVGGEGSGASWFEGVGGTDWRGDKNVNTDRLIDVLSANLEPVSPGQFGRTLLLAMVTGAVAAFGLMLATVGPRSDLNSTAHLEWAAAKLFFAFSIVLSGAPFLIRSIRPGRENETKWALLFFPLAATVALALVMLLLGRDAWGDSSRCQSNFAGTLPLLHPVFCCDSIGSPDLGTSSRSTYRVKALRRYRRDRRGRAGGSRLCAGLRQRYGPVHCYLV